MVGKKNQDGTGASVELHILSKFFPREQLAIGTETDDGGFYRFEFTPFLVDETGEDDAVGYTFAYSRRGVVQIVPLYTKLHPGRVYQRNVYLNVPANLRRCD